MEITTEMIKELRQATNAGVLDCKKALEAAGGNLDRAVGILREKGISIAAKKAGRETKEGLIEAYVHAGNKVAALVEVNCETDFVARTQQFRELAHELAMQVVAARPLYVKPEDVPADVLEREVQKYRAEVEGSGRPAQVIDQIVKGRIAQFHEETCLMEQPFIKDNGIRVKDLVTAKIAELGENIVVRRFARLELGEGS